MPNRLGYRKPEIKKIVRSKPKANELMAPENGSSESWTGSCCYKDG